MQDQAIVALLDGIRWLQAPPAWPDDATRSWLTERGSMTRRLEKHCGHIRVRRFRERFVPACIEAGEAALGPAQQGLSLGDVPLGQWLFRHRPPARDVIQFGRVGTLWARRARLRLPEGQPLLLTEAFLPNCPLYASGNDVPEQ